MKKLKLLAVTLIALMVLPFCVNADSKDPIKVHIFRGEGCGYCAAALKFFESIEDEYGKYFDLVEHEVWHDADNAALMTKVAEHFGESVDGVPYIVIGEKTFRGYAQEYNEEIIKEITELYNSGKFVDIVAQVKDGKMEENKDNTTIIIIAVALIGFVALFYFARDPEEGTQVKESKKEAVVKEEAEVKKTTTKKVPAKKTTTKKTTTTKKPAAKKTTATKKSTAKKSTTKKTTKK